MFDYYIIIIAFGIGQVQQERKLCLETVKETIYSFHKIRYLMCGTGLPAALCFLHENVCPRPGLLVALSISCLDTGVQLAIGNLLNCYSLWANHMDLMALRFMRRCVYGGEKKEKRCLYDCKCLKGVALAPLRINDEISKGCKKLN